MIVYEVKVDYKGTYWYVDGELHRLEGPAVEGVNGIKAWFVKGERHRIEGPAVEYADGGKSWYLHDECITEAEHKRRTSAPEEVVVNGIIYTKKD